MRIHQFEWQDFSRLHSEFSPKFLAQIFYKRICLEIDILLSYLYERYTRYLYRCPAHNYFFVSLLFCLVLINLITLLFMQFLFVYHFNVFW